ncbi:MAG: hypothetical protein ABFQ62_04890 [Patescibacteria group bacterium]
MKKNIDPSSTQRMTVSMPGYLYKQLHKYLEPGKRSSFIVEALEKEIAELRENLRKIKQEKKDPIGEFLAFGNSLPDGNLTYEGIKKTINKGKLMADEKGNLYREGYK